MPPLIRVLLHTDRGPTSFEDSRIVHNHICGTFRGASQRQGLVEDDTHWNETLVGPAESQSAPRLRLS